MARIVGIPARLATGFVPGHRDAITGQFIVREKDAHAWAEIYFPGVGWQPFDPTASVPLAGDATTNGSLVQDARNHALVFGLLAALLVLLVLGVPGVLAAVRGRLARRRASWSSRNLAQLERIGKRAGRARAPAETPREYASRARRASSGRPGGARRRDARRRRILGRGCAGFRAHGCRGGAILAPAVKEIP